MADDLQPDASPVPGGKPAKAALPSAIPRGGPFDSYGKPVTVAAVLLAAFSFLDKDPRLGVQVLEQFGIKWLFFCGLLYVVYDLLKLLIKHVARLVTHVGAWADASQRAAQGQTRLADAVQDIARKGDRVQEEQQRLTTYSVATAQRSVELSTENGVKIDQVATEVRGHGKILELIAEKVGVNAGS